MEAILGLCDVMLGSGIDRHKKSSNPEGKGAWLNC
jgi:hypothetical protein